MRVPYLLLAAVALVAGVSRAAEKREELPSPVPGLARALEILKEERLAYDPKTYAISIRRQGAAWDYRFSMLPDPKGRVLPDNLIVVTLGDDGQTSVFQGP